MAYFCEIPIERFQSGSTAWEEDPGLTLPQQRISFLDLPGEIRDLIYKYTFRGLLIKPRPEAPKLSHEKQGAVKPPVRLCLPKQASLIFASRLVHHEAYPHFWPNAAVDLKTNTLKESIAFLRQPNWNPYGLCKTLEILLLHLLPYQGYQSELISALKSLATRGQPLRTLRAKAQRSEDTVQQTPSHFQVELALWHFFSLWTQVDGVSEFVLVRVFPPSFGVNDLKTYVESVMGRLKVKGRLRLEVGQDGEMSVRICDDGETHSTTQVRGNLADMF